MSGRAVDTSKDTRFEGFSCRDLEKHELNVRVIGLVLSNGTVDATVVQELGGDNGK